MKAKQLSAVVLFLALIVSPNLLAATETDSRSADHEALRDMRKTIVQAVNTDNLELLTPVLHENVSITMVDQTVITSPQALKDYFHKMFKAEGSILKSVKVEPKPDIETLFVSDQVGINRGASADTYTLKSGRVVVLNTRWSSTVVKEGDGWKLLTLHVGVNLLDNPILAGTEQLKYWWAAAGLIVGLLAMFLWKWVRRARV